MLTSYRVLDFGQFVAAPTCARVMAEMGAEVIKVEIPPHGDRGRFSGLKPRLDGAEKASASTYYFQHNHTKKSLAIDYKSDAGRDIVLRLVEKSDVLVENFAPGVMARRGLAYEDLKRINPGLIMCSVSMAGQTGPLSREPGFDYIGAAYAGFTAGLGEPDRGPGQLPNAVGDSVTGITAAMAVAFALLHREKTGEGQYIEASLVDSYFQTQEVNVPKIAMAGKKAVTPRSGSLHPDGGPTGNFRAGDGAYIAIMVMPYQWPQMVRALGQPELADDPRFKSPRDRRANKEALRDVIETWMAGLETRDAALAALRAERIPCAPVLGLDEAMAHPHLVERGTIRNVSDPLIGGFAVPGAPAKFSAWEPPADLTAALLGEHNEAVLAGVLGMGDDEIAGLYEAGVLTRDPLLDRTSRAFRTGVPGP